MYFTHHFAHRETLSRAHSWLTGLGFNPRLVKASNSGIPRIVLAVESHQMDAVNMLINAAERTDPDGFPSFWDEARQPHTTPVEHLAEINDERPRPGSSIIGWHPLD